MPTTRERLHQAMLDALNAEKAELRKTYEELQKNNYICEYEKDRELQRLKAEYIRACDCLDMFLCGC